MCVCLFEEKARGLKRFASYFSPSFDLSLGSRACAFLNLPRDAREPSTNDGGELASSQVKWFLRVSSNQAQSLFYYLTFPG